MIRILLICDYYAPRNEVAAIRMTKLVKYLKLSGEFYIDVATLNMTAYDSIDGLLENDIKWADHIFRYSPSKIIELLKRIFFHSHKKSYVHISSKANKSPILSSNVLSSKLHSIKFKLSYLLNHLLHIWACSSFAKRAYHKLKNSCKNYDVVISSYGDFSGHLVAMKIKRTNSKIFWVADYRDAVIHKDLPRILRNYYNRFQSRSSLEANIITAVSSGVLESLPSVFKDKMIVLPNGYDLQDLDYLPRVAVNNGYFKLAYCGTLYSGKRDLSIVFRAIRELIDENIVNNEKISFLYAGNDFLEFANQAEKYNLLKNVTNNGYIQREKSLSIQRHANVLLLASWNTEESKGIITGKFYEYLMMYKPIICSISGTVPNSTLKEMIELANTGYCCEQAGGDFEYQGLKSYISELYTSFIHNGIIKYNPNREFIEKYNYRNIVKQLEQIIVNKE